MSTTIDELNYSLNNEITEIKDGIIYKYTIGQYLGKGSFSRVYEIKCEKSNQVYAAKQIEKKKLSEKDLKMIRTEISMHKSLDHPNILKLYRSFEDENFIYIILERCSQSNFQDLLKQRKTFSLHQTQVYMSSLVDALIYLKKKLIIHRDLKLSNILISEDNHLKLADFGISKKLNFDYELIREQAGTPNYMAPEVVNQQGYSFPADVWSLGVIIFTMISGICPFEARTVEDTYVKIKSNNYIFTKGPNVNYSFKQLIKKIFKLKPSLRSTIETIKDDPFFLVKEETDENNHEKICNNVIRTNRSNSVLEIHKSNNKIENKKSYSNKIKDYKTTEPLRNNDFKKNEVNPHIMKLLADYNKSRLSKESM